MNSRGWHLALLGLVALSVACSSRTEGERKATADDAPIEAAATPAAARDVQETVKEIEPLSISSQSILSASNHDAKPQVDADSGAPTLAAAVSRDIAEIGAHLRGDPKAVLEYLAQEIAYEPYTGVLRGVAGTYLAKAGNSADRALLLAELLRAGPQPVELRFASCEFVDSRPMMSQTRATDTSELARMASQVTDPDLASGLRWYREALTRARFEAGQAELQLRTVLEPVLKPILDSRGHVRQTENGHIWLQVHRGESWVDLDPSTESGAPPCSPTGTQTTLSAELFHRIALSVVVETLKDGMLSESEALRVERTTAEFAASRILFTFGEPSGLIQPREDTGNGLALYTPVLRIDGENFVGSPLALPRIVTDTGPQNVSGGFADVLGEDFYGGAEQRSIPDEEVMSAWIQVDMRAPDQADVSRRSEIFDRMGMAIRLKGSNSGFELVQLPVVDDEYGAVSSYWGIGLVLGELQAKETMLSASIGMTTVDGLSAILDGVLRTFPSVRRELGGRSAAPTVLLVGVVPTNGNSGQATSRVVFDALYVASPIPNDARDATKDAVASPFAEYLLASSVGSTTDELEDVVHVMRSARASSTPFATVDGANAQKLEGMSPTATARIESRVKRGEVLFTPARAPATTSGITKTAWWYMDPRSGVVADEHENGRHSGTAEYKAPQMKKPGVMHRVKKLACAVAVPFFVAVSVTNYSAPSKDSANIVKAFRSGGNEAERRRKQLEALRRACATNQVMRVTPPGPP